MSFRSFIYYCAMLGGCTAFIGWVLGLPVEWFLKHLFHITDEEYLKIGDGALEGLLLGLMVAFGVGSLDALLSGNRFFGMIGRIFVAVCVGSFGGAFGGAIGSVFVVKLQSIPILAYIFTVFGWTMTGLLIGAAPGIFDMMERTFRKEALGGAIRKLIHGLVGGFFGGLFGGLLFIALGIGSKKLFPQVFDKFWSPSAMGFIALGMCIGLLIGLAQVVLKEAWLKIESGRRAGRELMLTKPAITIGRAESCDVGLFGDPAVERQHARILQRNNGYLLADENTPGGTYLNGDRIGAPTPLRSGDVIRVGSCTLRFGERAKRTAR
jgi:hypothetical protein